MNHRLRSGAGAAPAQAALRGPPHVTARAAPTASRAASRSGRSSRPGRAGRRPPDPPCRPDVRTAALRPAPSPRFPPALPSATAQRPQNPGRPLGSLLPARTAPEVLAGPHPQHGPGAVPGEGWVRPAGSAPRPGRARHRDSELAPGHGHLALRVPCEEHPLGQSLEVCGHCGGPGPRLRETRGTLLPGGFWWRPGRVGHGLARGLALQGHRLASTPAAATQP